MTSTQNTPSAHNPWAVPAPSDNPENSSKKPSKFVKTPEELEKMRIAGKLASEVLLMIQPHVKAGVTTDYLNTLCHDYIIHTQKAVPAPLNYQGFPKSICTSINHVVCHGIPSDKKLKDGDIINIDITVKKDGYHGDTSMMFGVGKISILAQRLIRVTHECLWKGIEIIKPGITLGDIGHVIAEHAHKHHFSVVRDFCGHGIGSIFHEPGFQILHYGEPKKGMVLEPGMTFTIEPMINAGKYGVTVLNDGWTAVTKDRSLSAQWEHTLLCTDTGVEVLTLRAGETSPLILNT